MLYDPHINAYTLLLLQIPMHRLYILQQCRTAYAILSSPRVQTGREVTDEAAQLVLQRVPQKTKLLSGVYVLRGSCTCVCDQGIQ